MLCNAISQQNTPPPISLSRIDFVFLEAQAPWTEVYACRNVEGQLTLRCPTNQRIMIFSANYGNSSGYNCSAHNLTPAKRSGVMDDDNFIDSPSTIAASVPTMASSSPLSLGTSVAPPFRCDHDMTSFVKDL